MKKMIALLAALLLVFAVAVSQAEAGQDLLARIQAKGALTIATEGNWSPWTYHDEADQLTGFDIEVGTLLAEGLGVQPVFKEAEWSALLAGVETGVFDLACNGVGYTEERALKYDFSEPYVYTESVLVVRGDNTTIQTLEDLAGKTTSNSPNSTYAQLAESLGAQVTYAETLDQTLALVLQGRVDATINARGSVEDYLGQHPDANIRIVQSFPGEPVCIPIKKGEDSATLVSAVNEILSAARDSGKLSELSLKYFNADLTTKQ